MHLFCTVGVFKAIFRLEIVTYNVELNIRLDFVNKNTDYVTRSDYIFPQIVGVFRQYHHPDLS